MAANSHSVVVPAIDVPSCVTTIRSLGRRDIKVIAVAASASAPGFGSRYCAESVLAPDPTTDLAGYREALFDLAVRPSVQTVIPMSEPDVYALATRREAFSDHVSTLWPDLTTLQQAHDRLQLLEAARAADVAVPETTLLGETDDWSCDQIIKARFSLLGRSYVDSWDEDGVVEPDTTIQLPAGQQPDTEAVRAAFAHDPLVQQFIPGAEYSLWALYDTGEAVATCQKRQLRAWSYSGGTSIARETTRFPALEAAGNALLEELEWHGLAAIQFIRDARTGEFVLLEANPRTWISLSCAVRAGVDFPYYFWQTAGGQPVSAPTTYPLGVETHLPRGELSYLLSVLGGDDSVAARPAATTALSALAESFGKPAGIDYFSREDPQPYLRSLKNSITKQVGVGG